MIAAASRDYLAQFPCKNEIAKPDLAWFGHNQLLKIPRVIVRENGVGPCATCALALRLLHGGNETCE